MSILDDTNLPSSGDDVIAAGGISSEGPFDARANDPAGLFGSGGVFGKGGDLPEASEEERELLRAQADNLNQASEIAAFTANIQRTMLPVLLQQSGFNLTYDEDGNISGLERGDQEGQAQADELRDALTQRSLAALRGELPTNPALLRELEEREEQLQRELMQDFGSISAGRTSTPGSERKIGFERFRAETLENARRADIAQLTPLAQSGIAQSEDLTSQFLNRALTVGGSVTGQGFNQVAAGFGSAASNLAQNRQFLTQIQEQRRGQAQAAAGAGIGTAVGAIVCSKSLKENFETLDEGHIAEQVENLVIEKWNYKTDDQNHIGPYAEDFAEAFGLGDGQKINIMDMMSVLMITVKQQGKRLKELEAANELR